MTTTTKNSTIRAILIMVSSMLLSRGIGFLRTAVLASQAGTGSDADAYAFSFLLPDLLNQLLAGGVLSVTFIPLFQELQHNKDEQNRFFSNLFWIGTSVFNLGISIAYIFTPHILSLLAGKNIQQGEVFDLTVTLTRIILPAQLFFFWGALLNGVQYANKRFLLPSLTPVIYNLGIILGGLWLMPVIGIKGFAWGVVVGAFVGNVGLQLFGVWKTGVHLTLTINHHDSHLQEWFKKTLPLLLTLGLAYSNELMGRIFGSRSAEGAGALASLNYAYRLFMIFVGLFGQAFAGGVYPFISQYANEHNYKAMETTIFSVLKKTAIFTFLSSVMLFIVRFDITAFLFERGSFSAQSTHMTAIALAAYIPGMFFFSAVLLINRLFFALKKTYTTFVISLITLGITIPLYSTLGLKFGIVGIGLMGSFSAFLTFSLLMYQWGKVYPETRRIQFFGNLAILLVIALGAGSIALGIQQFYPATSTTMLGRLLRMSSITLIPSLGALIVYQKMGFLNIKSILRK